MDGLSNRMLFKAIAVGSIALKDASCAQSQKLVTAVLASFHVGAEISELCKTGQLKDCKTASYHSQAIWASQLLYGGT